MSCFSCAVDRAVPDRAGPAGSRGGTAEWQTGSAVELRVRDTTVKTVRRGRDGAAAAESTGAPQHAPATAAEP